MCADRCGRQDLGSYVVMLSKVAGLTVRPALVTYPDRASCQITGAAGLYRVLVLRTAIIRCQEKFVRSPKVRPLTDVKYILCLVVDASY
jgi:hypothetical protein